MRVYELAWLTRSCDVYNCANERRSRDLVRTAKPRSFRTRPGMQPLSRPSVSGCDRRPLLFWAAAFREQPEPGGPCPTGEVRPSRSGERNDYLASLSWILGGQRQDGLVYFDRYQRSRSGVLARAKFLSQTEFRR